MEFYLIYLMTGIIGGLLVGLVGSGIGLIAVPTLIFTLTLQGVNTDLAVHLAIGTSLSVVLLSTAISLITRHSRKLIHYHLLKILLPGTAIGAGVGSFVATLLTGKLLQSIFGIFLIVVGILSFKMKIDKDKKAIDEKPLPTNFFLLIISIVFSSCSTILGVSDGLLLVPFLNKNNIPIKNTIATATVCAFTASIVGILPFLFLTSDISLPENCIGYLYLPAFFFISLSSCIATPIGVHLNHILPESKVHKAFTIFIILIGLKLIVIR